MRSSSGLTKGLSKAAAAVVAALAGGVLTDKVEAGQLGPTMYEAQADASSDACGMCDPCAAVDVCAPCCDADRPKFGFILGSEPCFEDWISPMSNPVFFEDPRTLTEARIIFAHHNFPGDNLGGSGQLYALQVRAALTERLSLIATKDGFLDVDTDLLGSRNGWMNVALGLKYNLIRDVENDFILSGGLVYEAPTGSDGIFQGLGEGDFNLFLTAGGKVGELGHWISASGFRLPVDSTDGSQMWYWSSHYNVRTTDTTWAFVESNWFHWMKSGQGDNGVADFEGLDLLNLGASNVAGNDIVTMAAGLKWKPCRQFETGVAYEFPVSNTRDIIQDRLYVQAHLRY